MITADTPQSFWFGIISLFPEMFTALNVGITGRALAQQQIQLKHWNPRHFTQDKHQSVDDHPYGGGPGMVMRVEPLQAAIKAAKEAAPAGTAVIYVSPQGKKLNQAAIADFVQKKSLIFLAGRYEGIDERIIQTIVTEEWSIGDYILSGGELAAMVMIDAITRSIPGVLGDPESVHQDSLSDGILKYPQYTRPEAINGLTVPEVLLSGHHQRIAVWRLKHALGQTWQKRPDLLDQKKLTEMEKQLLQEYIDEFSR